MNRKTMFKTLLLAAFGMQMHAQSYCEPTWSGWAVNEPTEPISLVQLGVDEAVSGAINNASTALASADTPRYEDFSSTVMSVIKGESYTLKVKGNTDGDQTNYITVYFDWNGDGVFSNSTPADETAQQQLTNQPEKHQHLTALVNSNGEDDLEVTHTVTIPTDAVTGEIRMRVVKNYNAPSPAPCSNPFIFGQVEDYTLNIEENVPEFPTPYCNIEATAGFSGVKPITRVSFADINNTSSSEIDNSPILENFTDVSTDVVIGEEYELTVSGNTDGAYDDYVKVYFDWNKDNTFAESEGYAFPDNLSNSTGEDDVQVSINITVPTEALTGATRMRVIKKSTIIEGPCDGVFFYGQAEDYTINVSMANDSNCDNSLPGDTPGDTGCVTFSYGGELVTYTTVRGADGNVWIQQNLGSDSVGASATDVLAFGDLFQWGRWDDGHQSRTSTAVYQLLSPNNPTGLGGGNNSFYLTDPEWWNSGDVNDTWNAETPQDVTVNDGCDPCKALGEGWEVPTQAEWQTIIAAEEMDDIQSAYDSNLKLVVAGARSSSGVYNDGTKGYYWSKTISEDNSQFAKYLYYSNFIVNPNAGGFREQGSSVRCIYKQNLQEEITVEVTTENNTAAEITTENGTLQLVATVTPTDASQEVTWTIESGDEFVSVDDNGLVTAIANGVATIRATSIEDSTVFDEINVTVDIETANECESVETFLETFETFTEFPAQCWNANYTNYALSISDETVQLYSGGAIDEIIIVSPEVSTIDGQHVLAFDMVSITQPGTMLQVGTMTDNTDFTTFTAVGDSFAPVGGTTHTTATIPANEGHKYVAVKYTFPANSHIVLKLDNIEWKVAASNGRFDQNRVKIYPNPTSGLFYIDTDIAVRKIEVYNAMGQKVASTQHKEVDLSNVARGTYIVRVYATDGTFAAYKVVKK